MTVEVQDELWDGPHGNLPVRIYVNAQIPPRSGLVWAHGGSWMGGDLDMPESDWVCRSLASAGIWTVAVDYRLAPHIEYRTGAAGPIAPGHRFPVAHDEVVWAFGRARVRARDFGVAPGCVSLGGASAGGNLAAGAAMRIRDRNVAAPRSLVLAYPATHAALPPFLPHLREAIDGLPAGDLFEPATINMLAKNYAGERIDSPYAFPGGHSPHGLPPTYVLNSEFDTLRAGGEAFAADLALAGVEVLCQHEPGSFHGHLNRPDEAAAQMSIRRIVSWLVSSDASGSKGQNQIDSTTTTAGSATPQHKV